MTLHDRFTLRERVGVGGMSEVWRADDQVLGRAVAVKALAIPLAADPLLRAATWREARAAARLTHPHVTQVYDYGEAPLPGGTMVPYLVMELVDGESLADRLRSGPLPWTEAARIGAEVAGALTVAHGLGIVHRDIKPGNVMLTATGAKVLDFGIAALTGGGSDTDGGRMVGTPAYAAPERLQAAPATPAIDVYALGVTLYESLTGHPPVPAATWHDAAGAHRAGVPVAPLEIPGLPRRVSRLCLACLDPDPAERPTAAEVAASLSAAAGQPPARLSQQPAAPSGPLSQPPPAQPPLGQPPLGTTVLSPVGPPAPAGRSRVPAPAAGYAVGSAPLPHPRTMIEPVTALGDPPDAVPPGRLPRRLLIGLVAAVVVLGLALALVTAALLSGNGGRTAGSGPGSTTASPPVSAAPSTSVIPSPTSGGTVVDQLDQAISDALAAGRISGDTADKLRDQLNNLRDDAGRGRVRKAAQAMKKTIDELLNDGEIDPGTADQLNGLLDALIGEA
jgi:serine/threonine-protein kinase